MSELYLIRGMPGAGKTRLARTMAERGVLHFEMNQYFYTFSSSGAPDDRGDIPGKVYRFDSRELHRAAIYCQKKTEEAMGGSLDIVVANTFSQRWEMEEYLVLARKYEYNVTVIDLFDGGCTNEQLCDRGIHGVPLLSIAKQRARWEHDWRSASPHRDKFATMPMVPRNVA